MWAGMCLIYLLVQGKTLSPKIVLVEVEIGRYKIGVPGGY